MSLGSMDDKEEDLKEKEEEGSEVEKKKRLES